MPIDFNKYKYKQLGKHLPSKPTDHFVLGAQPSGIELDLEVSMTCQISCGASKKKGINSVVIIPAIVIV